MERPNSQNFTLTNNTHNPDSTNFVLTDNIGSPSVQNYILTEIVRLHQRIDKQDERINKQDEIREADRKKQQEDVQAILSRMDNTDFTNNTRFNNQDARFNIQDTRFSFIEDALKEIRGKIEDLGRDRAKNINIKDIIPDPLPGEEEYLKSLVAGKIPAWEKALTDAKSQCLESLVNSAIDASLGVYNFNRTLHTLHPNDEESFKKAFANSFTKEALLGPIISSSDPRIIAAELALKGLIAGGKLCYHLYQNSKDKSEFKKEWEQKINGYGKIVGYKETIKNYLKDSSEDGFNKMVNSYERNYHRNYNRNDLSVKISNNLFSEKGIFSRYITIKYKEIPDFEQYIYYDTDAYKNMNINQKLDLIKKENIHGKKEINHHLSNHLNVNKRFNSNDYLKDSIAEEEKNEFEWKFRSYRAFKEIGEFESKYWAGDCWGAKIMASLITIPLFGIGLFGGVSYGINRINTEVQWSNNTDRLRDILFRCVNGHSREILEEIIKQREILVRIKNYADISQSPFAKHFFEKCNKDKYNNIKTETKELFDEAFDLYQKLTNIGIANRDNYLKYGHPQKLAEDNGLGLKKIFLDAIDKTKNDFAKLPNQVTDKEEIITTRTMIDGEEKSIKTEIKHTQSNNQPGPLVMQMQNANQFHNNI